MASNEQLALIDAATTGNIIYSTGDYTVSDSTISASQLNSLNAQYSGTVDATAVTTIEGNNSSAPMAQALPSNRNGIWKRPRTGSDISKIHGFCRLPVKYLYGI